MDSAANSRGEEINLLHLSRIVFTGEFPNTMLITLDERDLFDGQVDLESRVRSGSTVQCTYASDKYQFRAAPDRIDVTATDLEVIPESLIEAAQFIAKQIDAVRRAVPVSIIGMNCDTILPRHLISESGERYCASLIKPQLKSLVGDESFSTMARAQLNRGPFQYDIRIEPHFLSKRENLYVAVGSYQALGQTDSLESVLKHTGAFREYVQGFHHRVIAYEIG